MSTRRTDYFTHPSCALHDMGDGHPEQPARLVAIDDEILGPIDCRLVAIAGLVAIAVLLSGWLPGGTDVAAPTPVPSISTPPGI